MEDFILFYNDGDENKTAVMRQDDTFNGDNQQAVWSRAIALLSEKLGCKPDQVMLNGIWDCAGEFAIIDGEETARDTLN